MKKIFSICAILLLLLATLLQRDYKNIENTAYVIAIGVDKREEKLFDYTFQFVIPLKFAGNSGESGGEKDENKNSENSSLYNVTISAPSVYAALDMTENIFAKTPDLSHIKLILFADDVSYKDMDSEIKSMIHSNIFRPNTYTAISNETAREFLEAVNPAMELDPAKYYELLFKGKYAPYAPVSTLMDLYVNSGTDTPNAVIPLASVAEGNDEKRDEQEHKEILTKDFNAENFLNLNTKKALIMGMVIFNDHGIAGKASSNDSLFYHMINGEFTKTSYTFYKDDKENNYAAMMLEEKRKPIKKITMNGYQPIIDIDISISGKILNLPSLLTSNNNLDSLKNQIEKTLEDGCIEFLNKLSKEYHSDIFGFSSLAKKYYLTTESWENEDWETMYKNAKFNVKINLNIERTDRNIE